MQVMKMLTLRLSLNPYSQVFQYVLNEIVYSQFWVKQEGCLGATIAIQFIKKIADQGCFPSAHFPGNDDKPFFLPHPIKQLRQGFSMVLPQIDIFGVWGHTKRIFS